MAVEITNTCPKCLSHAHVRAKKILIGRASPRLLFDGDERAGYRRRDQLAVDECKPEMLHDSPLEQFIDGYFCEQCGIGFVADNIVNSISDCSKSVVVAKAMRMMTADERIEIGRTAFELQHQFGHEAHFFAAKRAELALNESDDERAQFWVWVEATLKPR